MRPVLFSLGDFAVPAFWVAALGGFVAAFLVGRADVVRRGYQTDLAYDMLLHAYLGGWIGARLFVIPAGWDLFITDPIGFLLSSSGWVWYGGVIGGAAAMWLVARRERVPFLVLADITAAPLAIGQAIGRIGCQLSGDGDYGVPTALPWGMSYPHGVVPTIERVHPTPVYELLGYLAVFAYLQRRRRAPMPHGGLFGQYLVLAAGVRFVVEFVRRNPAWLAGLTTAQWISLVLIAIGALLVWRGRADTTPPVPARDQGDPPGSDSTRHRASAAAL